MYGIGYLKMCWVEAWGVGGVDVRLGLVAYLHRRLAMDAGRQERAQQKAAASVLQRTAT